MSKGQTVLDPETRQAREKRARIEVEVIRTPPWRSGAVMGVVAGLIMALIAMTRAWVTGEGFWMPAQAVAALFYGPEAFIAGWDAIGAGLLTHLAVSAVAGMLFGILAGRDITTSTALVGGLIYGIFVWAVMTYVVLPLFNPVMAERVALMPAWWFAYHLAFGLALGTFPAWTQPKI